MNRKFYCNRCQEDVTPDQYDNVDGHIFHCPSCSLPIYFEPYAEDYEYQSKVLADLFSKFNLTADGMAEISVHSAKKMISILTEQIDHLNQLRMNLQFRVAESGVK